MKLYFHAMSTFSRRVRMQLLEKGARAEHVEQVSIDMAKREHKGEPYRAFNPYGRVPAWVEDDFVLYESSAIMEYLETLFPEPPLLSSASRSRALTSMHIKLCDLELASHTRVLFFPRRFFPRERWDLPAQDAAIDAVAKHLAVLDQQLEGKQYLVEDRYSLAEIAYTPFVELLPLIGLSAPSNVQRWIALLSQRPSAIATRPADYAAPR